MTEQRRALVTGILGQDGSYLAELLLDRGYTVFGFAREVEPSEMWRIAPISGRIEIIIGDLRDRTSVERAVTRARPHEIYNLAASASSTASWHNPSDVLDINCTGVASLLSPAVKQNPSVRFFQASSCQIFGEPATAPQNEETPMRPHTPYAVAKAAAHWMVDNLRRVNGAFACNGILYNHESPRRHPDFVSRRISLGVARIKLGMTKTLKLGNLEARRDWGYAPDYVKAMWAMLQQDDPRDYIIGSGTTHSVRDFVQAAFNHVGLDCNNHLSVDEDLWRPAEPVPFLADPGRAAQDLGWRPTVSFEEIVRLMVDADLERLRRSQDDEAGD